MIRARHRYVIVTLSARSHDAVWARVNEREDECEKARVGGLRGRCSQ